jgi:hypothetical protein
MVAGSEPNERDKMNSIRCENSRHFRNKKLEYLKSRTGKLETNAITVILETCKKAKIDVRRLANLKFTS